MNIKNVMWLILFFCSVSFLVPKRAEAVDWLEVREKIEYFFTFKSEKKVEVLEKQADRRLERAQNFAENGNKEKVQNQIQGYLDKKEEQNNLLGKTDEEGVLKNVEERTIEQQKTMENIKTVVDVEIKQEVKQAQEQVVNQVAQRVIEVNGKEGQTEFFNKVEHVWAPGTSAGGGGGVVYEGGARIMFAPGTSSGGGGNAGADIKTVEVKGN